MWMDTYSKWMTMFFLISHAILEDQKILSMRKFSIHVLFHVLNFNNLYNNKEIFHQGSIVMNNIKF